MYKQIFKLEYVMLINETGHVCRLLTRVVGAILKSKKKDLKMRFFSNLKSQKNVLAIFHLCNIECENFVQMNFTLAIHGLNLKVGLVN